MANKERIIKILADKYNVSPNQVEEAVDSQFKFVFENITKSDMPQVRLPFFGIFKPNMKKVKKLNQINKDKNNNE